MFEQNAIYHFIQGTYSWSASNSLFGVQYKRIRSETEAGMMTFFTGYSGAINYTKMNAHDFLNCNLEFHFRSYPLTASVVRLGAGIDFSTNFKTSNYLSFFPTIALDIGPIEISYSYLLNTYDKVVFSDHRLKVSFGPFIKSKSDNR